MSDISRYNSQFYHRRSIRLKGYDYSKAGLYFITICTQDRACLFGKITVGASLVDAQNNDDQNDGDVQNDGARNETDNGNDVGRLDDDGRPQIGRPQGHAPTHAPTDTPKNKTVGDMLDAFKSITTVEYIHGVKQSGWKPFNGKIWQRNYYEHIIRDEQSYQNISNYIINNPAKWKDDKFYNQ